MNTQLKTICCVTILLFLSAGFLAPWWAGSKVLAPLDLVDQLYEPWVEGNQDVTVHNESLSDAVEQYLIYHWIAHQSFRQDGYIGWNRLVYCGMPYYAQTMALYSDWTMQLHKFLNFWTAWHLGLFFQFSIAMVGMFVLLRSNHRSHMAALLSSISFGFCSHFIIWICHRWTLSAFCWLPWVVWAMGNARKQGSNRFYGFLVPIFLALGFMGGHLQYLAFYVIICGIVCFSWIAEAGWKFCAWKSEIIRFSIWGILALGLSAPMLVPCVDAYVHTLDAGMLRGGIGYPRGWAQPLFNLLAYPTYVFPYALGSAHNFDGYKAFKSDWMYLIYIGSIPYLLAWCGLFSKRTSITPKFLAIAGLILPLTPLVGPLYQRLFILFTFAGLWLVAELVDKCDESFWKNFSRIAGRLYIIITVLWLLASVLLHYLYEDVHEILHSKMTEMLSSHQYGAFTDWFDLKLDEFIHQRMLWNPYVFIAWVIFGASIILLNLRVKLGSRSKPYFIGILSLFVLIELGYFAKDWVPWCGNPGPNVLYPTTATIKRIKNVVGNSRIFIDQRSDKARLFQYNLPSVFGIKTFRGYESIIPDGLNVGLGDSRDPVEFGARGVEYAIGHQEDCMPEGWETIEELGLLRLYRNRFSIPIYTADTSEKVLVEKETNNYRKLQIPAGATRLQVLENWDRGWSYRINGGEWSSFKHMDSSAGMVAEFDQMTMEMIVEMQYLPVLKKYGFWISGVSALFLVVQVWLPTSSRKNTAV